MNILLLKLKYFLYIAVIYTIYGKKLLTSVKYGILLAYEHEIIHNSGPKTNSCAFHATVSGGAIITPHGSLPNH
jgi:hypothetical protein